MDVRHLGKAKSAALNAPSEPEAPVDRRLTANSRANHNSFVPSHHTKRPVIPKGSGQTLIHYAHFRNTQLTIHVAHTNPNDDRLMSRVIILDPIHITKNWYSVELISTIVLAANDTQMSDTVENKVYVAKVIVDQQNVLREHKTGNPPPDEGGNSIIIRSQNGENRTN